MKKQPVNGYTAVYVRLKNMQKRKEVYEMEEYTKSIENIQMGGDMKDDKGITLKEAIRLYYGEVDLTDAEKEDVEKLLEKIEEDEDVTNVFHNME